MFCSLLRVGLENWEQASTLQRCVKSQHVSMCICANMSEIIAYNLVMMWATFLYDWWIAQA
jgi:hypothetical protein